MRMILLISFLLIILTQCRKKDEFIIPACIQQKIDSLEKLPKSTPPRQAHAWDYNGKRVYLFSAAGDHELVKVFDENCNYVCSPSGGATGFGDSTCTDFYQAAQHKTIIWKDDR